MSFKDKVLNWASKLGERFYSLVLVAAIASLITNVALLLLWTRSLSEAKSVRELYSRFRTDLSFVQARATQDFESDIRDAYTKKNWEKVITIYGDYTNFNQILIRPNDTKMFAEVAYAFYSLRKGTTNAYVREKYLSISESLITNYMAERVSPFGHLILALVLIEKNTYETLGAANYQLMLAGNLVSSNEQIDGANISLHLAIVQFRMGLIDKENKRYSQMKIHFDQGRGFLNGLLNGPKKEPAKSLLGDIDYVETHM